MKKNQQNEEGADMEEEARKYAVSYSHVSVPPGLRCPARPSPRRPPPPAQPRYAPRHRLPHDARSTRPGPAPAATATYLLGAGGRGGGQASRAISPRRPALPNQSPPRRPGGGQGRPISAPRGAGPVPMATGAGAAGVLRGCRAAPRLTSPQRTVPHRTPQILGRTPEGRPLHPRARETPRP